MLCWGCCKWLLFSVLHLKDRSKLRVWGNHCPLVLPQEVGTRCDFSEGEWSFDPQHLHKLSMHAYVHQGSCVCIDI